MKKLYFILFPICVFYSPLLAQAPVFYGTTASGGVYDDGAIIMFNPSTNTENVVWSFSGSTGDGSFPECNLVYDPVNGLFYGMTITGGSNSFGTIFSFNPANNSESVVWNLGNGMNVNTLKGNDGAYPFLSSLVYDSGNGLLYGMTNSGGIYGYGAIIGFNPTSNKDTLLWSFREDSSDGGGSQGNLVYDAGDGLFYGVTGTGGRNLNGTLFSFNPATNRDSVLWSLGQSDPQPSGSLVYDTDNGLFYAMADMPGYYGTIISFDPSTNKGSLLWDFNGPPDDGEGPNGNFIYDAGKGLFYGMTIEGGSADSGTIFTYDPLTNTESVVWNFKGAPSDVSRTIGSLVYNKTDGLFYGMSGFGGSYASGTIFNFNPLTNRESVIWNFGNGTDGYFPWGDIVLYYPLNTGIISPLSYCAGMAINIPYTSADNFNADNIFTAELSDSNGSFSSANIIGALTSTGPGIISGTIPSNTSNGTGYRIRVISSNPADTADDNGNNIIIGSLPEVTVNSLTICNGSNGVLAANGADTYSWLPANGLSATTGATVTANPGTTTTYTISGTNSCGSTTSTSIVRVNNAALGALNETICSGETYPFKGTSLSVSGTYFDTLTAVNTCDSLVTLNLSVEKINVTIMQSNDTLTAGGNGIFQWIDCTNGTFISNANDSIFVPAVSGIYAAIISNGQCADTTDCETVIATGIKSLSQIKVVSIYPNPTSGQVNINLQGANEPASINIIDVTGRSLVQTTLSSKQTNLDLSGVAPGVYFVRIISAGQVFEQKLIKQ